jgi:hypothetical protein
MHSGLYTLDRRDIGRLRKKVGRQLSRKRLEHICLEVDDD